MSGHTIGQVTIRYTSPLAAKVLRYSHVRWLPVVWLRQWVLKRCYVQGVCYVRCGDETVWQRLTSDENPPRFRCMRCGWELVYHPGGRLEIREILEY